MFALLNILLTALYSPDHKSRVRVGVKATLRHAINRRGDPTFVQLIGTTAAAIKGGVGVNISIPSGRKPHRRRARLVRGRMSILSLAGDRPKARKRHAHTETHYTFPREGWCKINSAPLQMRVGFWWHFWYHLARWPGSGSGVADSSACTEVCLWSTYMYILYKDPLAMCAGQKGRKLTHAASVCVQSFVLPIHTWLAVISHANMRARVCVRWDDDVIAAPFGFLLGHTLARCTRPAALWVKNCRVVNYSVHHVCERVHADCWKLVNWKLHWSLICENTEASHAWKSAFGMIRFCVRIFIFICVIYSR